MTVSPETLLAFIDGELSPEEARRVAAEVANDPQLAAHTEKHRALKARLQAVSMPPRAADEANRATRAVGQATDASADSAHAAAPASQPSRARSPTWISAATMAVGIGLGLLLAISLRPAADMQTEGAKA